MTMETSSQPPSHSQVPSRGPSMLRIFLSCTSVDLKQHRAAVRRIVDAFDEHPVVMEDFGARDGDATQVSLERVLSCDVYVLLLGWRYGSIPTDETLSVTHLEYRAAKEHGMPRLIFLADPDTEADREAGAVFPAAVRDAQHATQLRTFREEVSHDRVVATFTTPDNAAAVVAPALHHLLHSVMWHGPRPPYKLAPRAPEFVGRERELWELCERLRSGQSVGLSALIAGLAGVGKSALAAEALATLSQDQEAFPGGITYVRCDEREGFPGLAWLYDQLLADWDAALAPEQLAQVQIRAQGAGPEAEVELRERALQVRLQAPASSAGVLPLPPALVLLDNVEVTFPLARVLDVLSSLGITALVTARHAPSVARLQLFPLDVLDEPAAIQLFAERYRAQGGAWDEARDTEATATIVERLGWLPLAIELQAARTAMRQTPVAQVSSDLARDQSMRLLGDPLDSRRTMRYSFEQSLKTLTLLQRTRFAALGLPEGPDWPHAVIELLLAGISEQDDPSSSALASAQSDLDRFMALSLVTLPPDGRVRLHPLLRKYALELWQAESADTQTRGLHALLAGIHDMVTEYQHDFVGLAREEEMVVAALNTAQARHTALRWVIRVVNALNEYLTLGGHWRLGMQMGQWQLVAKRKVGDHSGEGITLNNLGYLADSLGQKDEARSYYQQALVIYRQIGDRAAQGAILNNLGGLTNSLGQKDEARSYFEQALAAKREVGNRASEGITLNNLGSLADDLGQKEEARAYFEQALAIYRQMGDRAAEGIMLNNLGSLSNDLVQKAEARSYYQQALALFQEVGEVDSIRVATKNLAYLE
jgi:tetratricopeptide (TPR) repeat protein